MKECRTQGLLFEYDTLSQFTEEFYRHLVRTVNGNDYFTITRESNTIGQAHYLGLQS